MWKYVDDTKSEYIELMKKLVSIKSLTCNEEEMAKFLYGYFKDLGIEETFIDGAGNVVSVIRGTGEGPNVLMNGHMDAVPEGSLENWAPYDPYVPEITDGWLIGRGISDLKGGLAAQIMAFKAVAEKVIKQGGTISGDLTFLAVVQEEPAEMFGMLYFFDHTMAEHNIKADVVYLAEPSSNDLAIGQRGKIELVVKTYGKCAHSSAPEQGVNALEFMVPVLDRIFKHEGINLMPDPKLGKASITVTNCVVRPGGTLSVIPDECEISIDRRHSTTQSTEDLLNEFEVMFEELKKEYPDFKATVEPRVYNETSWTGYNASVKKFHPAWETPEDNRFVVDTLAALNERGQTPKKKYWLFGTDGGVTCALKGIPTIGYSGAQEKEAHQPKEKVCLDEMIKTYEGYVAILFKLYGLDTALLG